MVIFNLCCVSVCLSLFLSFCSALSISQLQCLHILELSSKGHAGEKSLFLLFHLAEYGTQNSPFQDLTKLLLETEVVYSTDIVEQRQSAVYHCTLSLELHLNNPTQSSCMAFGLTDN